MTSDKRRRRVRDWFRLIGKDGCTFHVERDEYGCWHIIDMRNREIGTAASLEEARRLVDSITEDREDRSCLTSAG